MKYRKIYLRADAGGKIGWGHYYRSLALAEMLSERFDCRFFSNEEILDKLTGDEIVVLDNYFFNADYQKAIRDKGCKVVCIDDLHDRHFCADAIINFGTDDASLYDAEPDTKYYLGFRYAMLRKEFREACAPSAERKGWFVSFGGADTCNLTDKFVGMLKRNGESRICAVRPSDRYSAAEMADMMRSCEFALLSASNTCLEAMACGCKVFAGWWVDNQRDFYAKLIEKKLITPMGYLPEADAIPQSCPSPASLSLDGGARRFRMIFQAFNYSFINYRDLTPEQSRKVWETRNLDSIRRRMTNPEPFPFEGHLAFIERLKSDPSKLYYAVFDGEEFIGSYDFVNIREGESAERGLYVAPAYQGRSIGSMMEFFLEGEIRKRGVKRLFAEVLKDNAQSVAFHLRAGYEEYEEDDRFKYFKREL